MKPGSQGTYSLQEGSFKAISWTYCTVTILCRRGENKGNLWQCQEPNGKAWIRINSLPSLLLESSTPKLGTFFYTPSSQNFRTPGLELLIGRNEAQRRKVTCYLPQSSSVAELNWAGWPLTSVLFLDKLHYDNIYSLPELTLVINDWGFSNSPRNFTWNGAGWAALFFYSEPSKQFCEHQGQSHWKFSWPWI